MLSSPSSPTSAIEGVRFVCRVDQQLRAGASAAQQVAVVVVGADGDLADDQLRQLAHLLPGRRRSPHPVYDIGPPGRSGHTQAGATGSGELSEVRRGPWGRPSSQASRSASVPRRSGPVAPDLPSTGRCRRIAASLTGTSRWLRKNGCHLTEGAQRERLGPVDRLVLGTRGRRGGSRPRGCGCWRGQRRRPAHPNRGGAVRAPRGSLRVVESGGELPRPPAWTSCDELGPGQGRARSISAVTILRRRVHGGLDAPRRPTRRG